ncbi:MAG: prolyl-tRNA synthetase associated domain-containing protein [Polymorphobacter sp.]
MDDASPGAQAQSASEARLHADLARLGINWTQVEHDAVFTVDESAHLHAGIAGMHSKNLFLKDAGARFWLVTVPADLRVDLKALPAAIGSKRLSFGNAADMARLLGVTPGSVTPLAAIDDSSGAVTVVLDLAVANASWFNVHPLRNTASLGLSGADLCRALAHWQHRPTIVAVPVI